MVNFITDSFKRSNTIIFSVRLLSAILTMAVVPLTFADNIGQVAAIKIAETDAGCGNNKICQFDASSLDKGWYIIVRTVRGFRTNGDPIIKPGWVGYIISAEGKLLDKKPGH